MAVPGKYDSWQQLKVKANSLPVNLEISNELKAVLVQDLSEEISDDLGELSTTENKEELVVDLQSIIETEKKEEPVRKFGRKSKDTE